MKLVSPPKNEMGIVSVKHSLLNNLDLTAKVSVLFRLGHKAEVRKEKDRT